MSTAWRTMSERTVRMMRLVADGMSAATDLVRTLQVSKPAVHMMTSKMVAAGYMLRVSPGQFEITDKGRERLEAEEQKTRSEEPDPKSVEPGGIVATALRSSPVSVFQLGTSAILPK